jgi:hypothetical protein
MKRILMFLCFAMTVSMLCAQKIYFVYLQTENNDPFFVRMDDKLFSSSPSGYLILSRLKDSTYHFRLGFPGKDIDLDFSTTINKKDHGYLVKNFGEKGWGLFDLQSLGIQMSTSKVKSTAEVNKNDAQVDAFTDLLSRAAGDPSLKQNVIWVKEEEKKPVAVATVEKEEKKPEITDAVVKQENKPEVNTQTDAKLNEKKPIAVDNVTDKKPAVTAAAIDQGKSTVNTADRSDEKKVVAPASDKQTDSAAKTPQAVKTESVYKRSLVTKISCTDTRDGFESVFVDEQNGKRDTIRIFIPGQAREAVAKEEPKSDSAKDSKKFLEIDPDKKQSTTTTTEVKNDQAVKWWPFGNVFGKKEKDASKTESQTKSPSTQKSEGPKKWNPFSKNKSASTEAKKCEPAVQDDFLKLRRKMAEKTNDDGMLEEARKYFKEKCFTTEQIKNLSSMFLSNAGKYNFFEVAHNNVTDKENFSSLQSELKDEYYVGRFKTLVGN